MTKNADNLKATVIRTIAAVGEAIRDLGSVPSGHLYNQLMGRMGLNTYNQIIQKLVDAKLVKNQGHLLIWIGPDVFATSIK